MEFRILGPLEMRGGAGLARLGGPRPRGLLAMLLLNANRMVGAGQLVDTVWDRPPTTSMSKLRTYVSELRRSLRESGESCARLQTRPGGYLLRLEPDELDLYAFEDLADRGRRAGDLGDWTTADHCFERALDLWRGEPLDGLLLTPALHAELTRLVERRATVVEQSIGAKIELGMLGGIVGDLRRFVSQHPLRENAWARLMLVLYQSGRQAEALQSYLDARQMLAESLGIEPGPELQRLHQRILSGDPDLEAPPARSTPAVREARPAPRASCLPCDAAHFTGRQAEQRRLLAELEAVRSPVTLIDGMAGAGKTTLAIHVAHQLADRFPDGQFFVELHAHRPEPGPTDPGEALASLLGMAGVTDAALPARVEARAALWRAQLAGRRAVLILDDAESAAQVRPLLPGSATCRVLVTSRSRIPELTTAGSVSLGPLPRTEAAGLFTEMVGADRVGPEREAVDEIVRLCGGLPEALRIAATRLRTRPAWRLADLAARLARSTSRPAELAAGTQRLSVEFAASYRRLDAAQQRTFRLVGLHPGADCTLPAAAALIGRVQPDAEHLLESLLEQHMIQETTAGRFRMHELLRCYAQHQADLDEPRWERHAAIFRLTESYIAAAEHATLLRHPAQRARSGAAGTADAGGFGLASVAEAQRWTEAEFGNLLATARHALESDHVELAKKSVRLVNALHDPCLGRGHYQDRIELGKLAGRTARRVGLLRDEARVLEDVGVLHDRIGRFQEGEKYTLRALRAWQDIGDSIGEARCLVDLGRSLRLQGTSDEAITTLRRARRVAQQADYPVGAGVALDQLGAAHQEIGRLDDAISLHRQSAAELESLGEPLGVASAVGGSGWAYLRAGDPGTARRHLHRALEIFRQFGDGYHVALLLWGLGQAHTCLDGLAAARTYWNEAIDALSELELLSPDRAASVRLAVRHEVPEAVRFGELTLPGPPPLSGFRPAYAGTAGTPRHP